MKVKQFVKKHWKGIGIGVGFGAAFVSGALYGHYAQIRGATKVADWLFAKECQLLRDQTELIFDTLKSAQIIENCHAEEALERIVK